MKLVAVFLTSAMLLGSPQVRDAGVVVTTGTAQISGTVLSGDISRAPVRRATMTLTGDRSGVQLVAVTDDSGQFTFTSLPPDRYTVTAAKGGYLPSRYGSRRPGGSGHARCRHRRAARRDRDDDDQGQRPHRDGPR